MKDWFKTLRPLDAVSPVLALVLLWPILAQYERPVQTRDFGSLGGGSADFASYYRGSLAYVRGFDPYLNGREEFRDPWRREIQMYGVPVGQYYLPGHYLAFAPLAWVYGDDWEAASRTYSMVQSALLAVLAWIVAFGARGKGARATPLDSGSLWSLWALGLLVLGLHLGVRLGLERGQSDGLQAALMWGGVLCAVRGRMGAAGFLLVVATSFKGYGLILLAGLGLARMGAAPLRPFILGALAAGLPILALGWGFLATGLRVALHQSEDFSFHWMNHSFKHLGWAIAPGLADPLRYLISLVALVFTIASWRAYRAACLEDGGGSTPALVVAATASLATMLGFSATSAPYNLVMVLPGLLWLWVLVRTPGTPLSGRSEGLFAVSLLLIVIGKTAARQFAPAAYGLVLLVSWCFLISRRRNKT